MNSLHSLIHRLHNQDVAALFIRLALGIVFIHAGYLKYANMDFTLGGFVSMGFPVWIAYLVTYAELTGGILLILGIFVRYVGIVLGIIMLVALFKVHLPSGYGLQNNGYEYVLLLFLVSVAAITLGAGKYSLARLIKRNTQTV